MNVLRKTREETILPVLPERETGRRTAHVLREETAASLSRRRFDTVSIGFWLGGIGLGAGGCVFGASMPYHHHVAVAMSVIWWGVYFGCFGASLGALLGLLTCRARRRS